MKATIEFLNKNYALNLNKPIDISIPIKAGMDNPNCFWAPYPVFDPYRAGSFVGATAEGAPVNFFNIKFNPHGTGTHTECVGHIAKEKFTINDCLKTFWFKALLISVHPKKESNGDQVIHLNQLQSLVDDFKDCNAFIIRTLPNTSDKLKRVYSGTNPTYLHHEAMQWLVENGIAHFLIDLPSVDREEDDGLLLSHHTFWNYPAYGTTATEEDLKNVRSHQSITELIYVPDTVKDGSYFLNLQIASFDLDVSPSKPVLYAIN